MVPFLTESNTLFLDSPGNNSQAIQTSLTIRMSHFCFSSIVNPSTPLFSSLKIGLQKPKVLFIDCERSSPQTVDFLNTGLSFVPSHACRKSSCVIKRRFLMFKNGLSSEKLKIPQMSWSKES